MLDSPRLGVNSIAAWVATNFEDICKRNPGRRKLHMRKRNARADRIVRVLASKDFASALELRKTRYGVLTAPLKPLT